MKSSFGKTWSGPNEEVKSLVEAALSKIDEAQKTRERAKSKWFRLRRLSLPSLQKWKPKKNLKADRQTNRNLGGKYI